MVPPEAAFISSIEARRRCPVSRIRPKPSGGKPRAYRAVAASLVPAAAVRSGRRPEDRFSAGCQAPDRASPHAALCTIAGNFGQERPRLPCVSVSEPVAGGARYKLIVIVRLAPPIGVHLSLMDLRGTRGREWWRDNERLSRCAAGSGHAAQGEAESHAMSNSAVRRRPNPHGKLTDRHPEGRSSAERACPRRSSRCPRRSCLPAAYYRWRSTSPRGRR